MQSGSSANGTLTIILTLSESFALEVIHKPCGNGVGLPKAGVRLTVTTRRRLAGMADLLLSIVVDPVFVCSSLKHLIFVTADMEKFLFICLLDLPLCLLQQ